MDKKMWWKLIIIFIVGFVAGVLSGLIRTNRPVGPVLPPLYLSQMDACEKEGGQIERETTPTGAGWEALSKWRCVCKTDVSFINWSTSGEYSSSGRLPCNQWLEPEIR
jgi:hypothetical protein